jgi:GTP-binding protein
VVRYRDEQSFVMADIPGLIEGAAEGKGLGHRFLRHIERNSVLLFVVSADATDVRKEYQVLINELSKYNPELLDKNRILAISKSDMLDDELMTELERELPELPHVFISSLTGYGLDRLKDMVWEAFRH